MITTKLPISISLLFSLSSDITSKEKCDLQTKLKDLVTH